MAHTTDERERRLAERERAVAADETEARRLLAEARSAHRAAERERARTRKLAGRVAAKLHHSRSAARAQLDADRAALDARTARFDAAQTTFHTAAAADRDRQRTAWADLAARQKRLAAEWEEATRFHAEQARVLDARAAELAARDKTDAAARTALQREVAALREEAAALDVRARNARQLVDELEQRRAELRTEPDEPLALAPVADPSSNLTVALDRAADRDLDRWAGELAERETRLAQERSAVQALTNSVSAEKATLADRRLLLTEQLAQLATARAGWQEAERATVVEMEQLARTMRLREAELDAREQRLARADSRRREDAYELWQLRLRLEAWQSKIVAYELRWHTEREQLEAEFARREAALLDREALTAAADGVPLAMAIEVSDALPAELTALRDELDRMAAVLLETDLPEAPDPPDTELPWGAEDAIIPMASPAEPDGAELLYFDAPARAA